MILKCSQNIKNNSQSNYPIDIFNIAHFSLYIKIESLVIVKVIRFCVILFFCFGLLSRRNHLWFLLLPTIQLWYFIFHIKNCMKNVFEGVLGLTLLISIIRIYTGADLGRIKFLWLTLQDYCIRIALTLETVETRQIVGGPDRKNWFFYIQYFLLMFTT